jgi:hypothetical protein
MHTGPDEAIVDLLLWGHAGPPTPGGTTDHGTNGRNAEDQWPQKAWRFMHSLAERMPLAAHSPRLWEGASMVDVPADART